MISSRSGTLAAIAAGVCSGVLAGICTVVLFSHSTPSPPAQAIPTQQQFEMRPAQSKEEVPVRNKPAPTDPGRAAVVPSSSTPVDQEPIEDDVQATQHFEQQIDRHRTEPIDAGWSKTTARSLAKDLGSLGEKASFEVVDIDCRRTTCVAELEWPSYAQANSDVTRILAKVYEINCGMGLSVPEPKDRNAPYRATVLFDCHDTAEVN